MKHYKAFKKVNGRLTSVYARNELQVFYPVGEWVSAADAALRVGYGLCYFDDNSADCDLGDEVWEVEIGEEIPVPRRRFLASQEHRHCFDELERIHDIGGTRQVLPFVAGTKMTDKVKLIRKIWSEEEDE